MKLVLWQKPIITNIKTDNLNSLEKSHSILSGKSYFSLEENLKIHHQTPKSNLDKSEFGVLTFPHGGQYFGEMLNNSPHGQGTMHFKKNIVRGHWNNGDLVEGQIKNRGNHEWVAFKLTEIDFKTFVSSFQP